MRRTYPGTARTLLLTAALAAVAAATAPAAAQPAEPTLIRDVNPGEVSSEIRELELTAVGDEVYFTVVAPSGAGDGSVSTALWRSDGTETGTTLVWTAPGRSFGYAITELALLGDRLLFTAPTAADDDGVSIDYELYALEVEGGGLAGDAGDR